MFIRYQRGSAMTEFVILAGVMVPAAIAIPMLGKIADANHETIEASRYVAWERTILDESQKSDEELAIEVRNRFFMDQDLMIETDQEALAGEEFENPFWSYQDGEETAGLVNYDEDAITVETQNTAMPNSTGAGIISRGVATVGSIMENFVADSEWDLEPNGLYIATVNMQLNSNTLTEGDAGNCSEANEDIYSCVSKLTAIFVDGWDAGSPDQTADRVRTLVPGGAFRDIGNAIAFIGNIPLFEELADLEDAFGHVDPDVLPPDRHGDE